MLVIFKGDPIELERGGGLSRTSLVIEGVTFYLNQAADASGLSDRMKQKLHNNPHFEVLDAPSQPASFAPAADGDAEEAAAAEAHAQRARARKPKAE